VQGTGGKAEENRRQQHLKHVPLDRGPQRIVGNDGEKRVDERGARGARIDDRDVLALEKTLADLGGKPASGLEDE
jgi:hypothetical protein